MVLLLYILFLDKQAQHVIRKFLSRQGLRIQVLALTRNASFHQQTSEDCVCKWIVYSDD